MCSTVLLFSLCILVISLSYSFHVFDFSFLCVFLYHCVSPGCCANLQCSVERCLVDPAASHAPGCLGLLGRLCAPTFGSWHPGRPDSRLILLYLFIYVFIDLFIFILIYIYIDYIFNTKYNLILLLMYHLYVL